MQTPAPLITKDYETYLQYIKSLELLDFDYDTTRKVMTENEYRLAADRLTVDGGNSYTVVVYTVFMHIPVKESM